MIEVVSALLAFFSISMFLAHALTHIAHAAEC
jgi:hypothetical protein